MKNNHLQRFLNSNNRYLINELLKDKYILDIVCFIYLCNKITTIDALIDYFCIGCYANKKSITHLKDVLKTLTYFKLIVYSKKIVRLDRKGLQFIENKENVTRASTNIDYLLLNYKSLFISNALQKLESTYNKSGIDLDLIRLCRMASNKNLIRYDIIVSHYNISILFCKENESKLSLIKKSEEILKAKEINIYGKIYIICNENFYKVNFKNLDNLFNLYNVVFVKV